MLVFFCCFKDVKAAESINVYIDGDTAKFNPIIINDRIMIPYTELEDAFNINIKPDNDDHTAVISKNIDFAVFPICSIQKEDSLITLQNGQIIESDTPITENNGVVYIPMRILCDILGFSVEWDDQTRTATVDTQSFVNSQYSEYPLLEEKLRISLPNDTLCSEYINSFIHPNSELFIARNKTEIRILAGEMFLTSNGSFVEDINKLGYDNIQKVYSFNNMDIALVQFDDDKDITMSYILRGDTGYLFSLTFYASLGSNDSKYDIIQFIENSIETVELENRTIDFRAKTYSLDNIEISVPDGYVVYRNYGIDFTLWHIQQVRKVGESPNNLLIYSGYAPDYYAEEKNVKVFRSSFMGTELDWFTRGDNSIEALCRKGDNMFFHLIITAETEKEQKALINISEKVRDMSLGDKSGDNGIRGTVSER